MNTELVVAKRVLLALEKHKKPAGELRRKLFSKLLGYGICEWYNNPKGIKLDYMMLWLKACEYDRKKFTAMGKEFSKIDNPSSIMAEFHVGVLLKMPPHKLMWWQESIAVYDLNTTKSGGNAGRDWPKEWTGRKKNIEVKRIKRGNTLFVTEGLVYPSSYIVVKGSVKIGFKIVGGCSKKHILKHKVSSIRGSRCHVVKL